MMSTKEGEKGKAMEMERGRGRGRVVSPLEFQRDCRFSVASQDEEGHSLGDKSQMQCSGLLRSDE
jgi:hypothetical protein